MDVIDWADADDPVAELHKLREQLLEEAGGFEAYMQKIMREQKNNPNVVDLSKDRNVQKTVQKKAARKSAKPRAARGKSAVRTQGKRNKVIAGE